MKYTVPFLMLYLFLSACHQNSAANNTSAATATEKDGGKDSVAAAPDFFPVSDYIGGQVRMIDSMQLPLSKSVTVNNRTRLAVSSDEELRQWAKVFREPDITSPALRDSYTSTSIADQSVPSVTFIYSTKDVSLPVQKINVFVKPDPIANDKVTGVYMEKTLHNGDTIINQVLYWKTAKYMQVTTEKKINGKVLPLEQVRITWDPSE